MKLFQGLLKKEQAIETEPQKRFTIKEMLYEELRLLSRVDIPVSLTNENHLYSKDGCLTDVHHYCLDLYVVMKIGYVSYEYVYIGGKIIDIESLKSENLKKLLEIIKGMRKQLLDDIESRYESLRAEQNMIVANL